MWKQEQASSNESQINTAHIKILAIIVQSFLSLFQTPLQAKTFIITPHVRRDISPLIDISTVTFIFHPPPMVGITLFLRKLN